MVHIKKNLKKNKASCEKLTDSIKMIFQFRQGNSTYLDPERGRIEIKALLDSGLTLLEHDEWREKQNESRYQTRLFSGTNCFPLHLKN